MTLTAFRHRARHRILIVFLTVGWLLVSSTSIAESPLQILALGDSYTIGTSVSEADRWPNLLQKQLIDQGLSVSPVEIVARNGWTSSQLLKRVSAGTGRDQYDWVTLLIGVNNQYQGQSTSRFADELDQLIKLSSQLTDGNAQRVLVLTIPDWSVSPAGQRIAPRNTSRKIHQFNQVLIETAKASGVQLIDIRKLVEDSKDDASYFASDQLHFSQKMHKLWAAQAVIAMQLGDVQ